MKKSKLKSLTETTKIDLTEFYDEEVFVVLREATFEEMRLLDKADKDSEVLINNLGIILPNVLVEHNIFEDDGKTQLDNKEVITILFEKMNVAQAILEGYLNFLGQLKKSKKA